MTDILETLANVGEDVAKKTHLPIATRRHRIKFSDFNCDDIALYAAICSSLSSQALHTEKTSIESHVRDFSRQLKQEKQKLNDIARRIQELQDIKQLYNIKRKEIAKIFDKLLVIHAEFKPAETFIFTTNLLKKKNLILGQFRIWIDLTKHNGRDAVRVVNICKYADDHIDHPCISQGVLCVGTFNSVLENVYKTQDLFQIVEAIIAFIVSPNVEHGFINSWETWNNRAKNSENIDLFARYHIEPGGSLESRAAIKRIYEKNKKIVKDQK